MEKLFFFGDSIAFGHMVSIHQIWTTLVSRTFESSYICNNPSKNGNTTKDALGRMAHDLETHSPDVVVMQFGLNDANFWQTDQGMPRISAQLYKANLIELVARLRDVVKVKKIVLATNHLPIKQISHIPENKYRDTVQLYNELVRAVANEESVRLVDHEKAWSSVDTTSFLLADGVHLSREGHHFYFETILDAGVL